MAEKVTKMVKVDPIRELLNDEALCKFIAYIAAEPGTGNVTVVVLRKAGADTRDVASTDTRDSDGEEAGNRSPIH